MYRNRNRKSGFTLVEILIVVIILGILAAIVIPQFTNASQDARKSNMASQVQTLKSQIELFKLQHFDKPPALLGTDGWTLFTLCTSAAGTVSTTAVPDTTYPFGPYMQAIPVNPLTGSSVLVSSGGSPASTDGWAFDATTGAIHGIAVDGAGVVHMTDDGVQDLTGTAITY